MADELRPPEHIASGFAGLTEGIRADMRAMEERQRDDAEKAEARLTARIATIEEEQTSTRGLIERFARDHGVEHEAEAEDRRKTHSTFYEFIRAAELDAARRDGALGIVRYAIELLSKHGTRIAWIVLSIGAATGVATGNIDVSVGGG